MKNNLFLFLALFILLSCRNETPGENKEAASAEAPAASQDADPQAQAAGQEAQPLVSALPAFEPPRSQDMLTIIAQPIQVNPGAEACVPVKVEGFNNLLAMQYTLAWDPKVLEFKGVNKPGLPYLDQADFGFNRTKEGLLPFVWINDALQPTTVPDGSVIYEACFAAIGASGQSTAIRFVQQPTPFEVVNGNEEILGLKPVEGKVAIR